MDELHTTELATKQATPADIPAPLAHSAVVQDTIVAEIRASLLSALPNIVSGPVEQCSVCVVLLDALAESVKMHVPAARPAS